MIWREFLETRSPLFIESMEAIQRGEIPPVFIGTRVEQPGVGSNMKPIDSWYKTKVLIQFLIIHRGDPNHPNCIHTCPRVSFKQFNAIREYYSTHAWKWDI